MEPALIQLEEIVRSAIASLPNILIGLLVFVIFFLIARGVRRAVYSVTLRSRNRENLATVLSRLAQWSVMLAGLMLALTIILPSLRPAQLIELLGIGSVAIGFAFRDILQNFLSGILILLTEPFVVGDQIIIDKFEGTVVDIQTRATLIRTYDSRHVVIPNALLFTGSVTVNTASSYRRWQADVGIGYGDNIAEAQAFILEAVQGVDGVVAAPRPEALVVSLAEFDVKIRVFWWTASQQVDGLRIQSDVLTVIKQSLIANGIDLPFPTYQVLFHDQSEDADGDRTRQREGWPPARDRAYERPS